MRCKKLISIIAVTILTTLFFNINVFTLYEKTYINTGDMIADIIGVAETQLGYKEGNINGEVLVSNNISKYGEWYGINPGAWCAMFVSWCANEAEIPVTIIPSHANCDVGMQWFKDKELFQLSPYHGGTYSPKAGDIVYFGTYYDSTHVGIVTSADSNNIYTIEGNATDSCKRVQYAKTSSYIIGYGTPQYINQTSVTYTDISENDIFYNAVMELYEEGIMNGVSENKFAPDEGLTRGMFVTMLGRDYETNHPLTGSYPFDDVNPSAYYADYVGWAYSAGIINGYNDSMFAPDEIMTREQMAKILCNYAKLCGKDTSAPVVNYPDSNEVSPWAEEGMNYLLSKTYISPVNGLIYPHSIATRSVAAVALVQLTVDN